jgi:hypothetical protein
MAFEKKVAINNARHLQTEIAYHLVKLSMYSESLFINHWSQEVNTWLKKIQRHKLKGTNRPLDKQDLFNILFVEPLETIDEVQDYMNDAYEEYPDLQIDQPSAAEINKNLAWQLQGICQDIARKQFKDIRNYK